MIAGLLEGAAFLAARVQLKLKHEFPEFCINLLEQLVPNYLAPTPSAIMVGVVAAIRGSRLARRPQNRTERLPGRQLPGIRQIRRRGPRRRTARPGPRRPRKKEKLEIGKRVSCRFRLTSDIAVWPFEIAEARYESTSAPIHALGVATMANFISGLRLTLKYRGADEKDEDAGEGTEASDRPENCFLDCNVDELTFHLHGCGSGCHRSLRTDFCQLCGCILSLYRQIQCRENDSRWGWSSVERDRF